MVALDGVSVVRLPGRQPCAARHLRDDGHLGAFRGQSGGRVRGIGLHAAVERGEAGHDEPDSQSGVRHATTPATPLFPAAVSRDPAVSTPARFDPVQQGRIPLGAARPGVRVYVRSVHQRQRRTDPLGEGGGVTGRHEDSSRVAGGGLDEPADRRGHDREPAAHRDVQRSGGRGAAVGKDDEVSGGEESGNLGVGDVPVDDGQSVRRQDRRELLQRLPVALPDLPDHADVNVQSGHCEQTYAAASSACPL